MASDTNQKALTEMKRSKNQWFPLGSGRIFDFSAPRPEMIDVYDIAWSLAKLCRFNGHCRAFYSVAQHSCVVAELIGTEDPFAKVHALLHDAHEAYIGDIIAPLKRYLDNDLLKILEARIDTAIFAHIGIEHPNTDLKKRIKHADLVALATECRDLLDWPEKNPQLIDIEDIIDIKDIAPAPFIITPQEWQRAGEEWTDAFAYWTHKVREQW